MILDHRTYTCRPGTIRVQLALYEEFGFPAQVRHLGQPLLYAMTDVGDINTYVHVWMYESAADRAAKRQAMQADPDWQAYLKRSAAAGNLVRQENKLLTPVPFHRPGAVEV